MNKLISAVVLSYVCAACSSSPGLEPEPTTIIDRSQSQNGLSTQVLAPGECGLFLWNRTNARTFLFFQRAGEANALYFDEEEFELSNVANDGVLFGAFYTMSRWHLPDGRSVSLSITPGEEIDGGLRIPSGVINTRTHEGWQVKTPVAGVTACQAE